MNAIRSFLSKVKKAGTLRKGRVCASSMGTMREFRAWDLGDDTFIAEKGIYGKLDSRLSVLIVAKADLRRGAKGRVITVSTGNHSVAAFPLLDGRFWGRSPFSSRRTGGFSRRAGCRSTPSSSRKGLTPPSNTTASSGSSGA